jgi:SAM-dependent methyltransferase
VASATDSVAQQYGDSRQLAARARLNRDHGIAETPWFAWVARQLGFQSNDHVLDVGCGPGWFWSEAASEMPEGLALTLVDASAGMVAEALQACKPLRLSSVEGRTADAASLPFADSSFDKVVAMHMLYHVPEPAAAIAEMYRVLKPGGLLAVTTNGPGNMQEIRDLAWALGSGSGEAETTFGYADAERLMRARFGNVTMTEHAAHLRITDPQDVFLALTSYPPGDGADEAQRAALQAAIAAAFQRHNDVLDVRKETGLFISRKL